MKRLVLSLLGGFLIPFIYTIIVVPLSFFIGNRTVEKLVALPVRWPINLVNRVLPMGILTFSSEYALITYVIVANVLLYSVLTYLLLRRFSKRKQKVALPPEPPQFATD